MKRRLRKLTTEQRRLKELNPILRKVRENLADSYHLVYIDQGDRLTPKQVAALLRGENAYQSDDLTDLDEWESEARYRGAVEVIKEILYEEEWEILDANPIELSELRCEIEERDVSDPYGDMLRQTGSLLYRYDVEVDVNTTWASNDEELADQADELAEALGYAPGHTVKDLIESDLLPEASYGGHAWILFYIDVEEMWKATIAYDQVPEEKRAEVKITFTRPWLLVLDKLNGSGHDVRLPVDVTLPFDPARLTTDDDGNGYSWDSIAGLVKSAYGTEVTFQGLKPEQG